MQINFLGPLEVIHNGHNDVPSQPKLRQVLTLLASSANQPVSTERLVDEVWEEHPPSSASTTMQTYVYHLRRKYGLAEQGSTGQAVLRTIANGYQLDIPENLVDGLAFGQSWASLRRTRGHAPKENMLAEIQEALGRWRGEAFQGVVLGPNLNARKVLLEEQRRVMTLQRIDLELALGRHHELVVELRRAIADHGEDDGLTERLMLALYRSGRRLESLEVFRRAREEAVETMGLEPHPSLQKLHERILRGDDTLDLDAAEEIQVSSGAAPVPDSVPAVSRTFVGRDAHIRRARLCFENLAAPCVALVTGFPGSGRTELALQVVRDAWDLFPDGHLYASLAHTDISTAVAGFLAAAGFTASQIPTSFADRCSVFRGWASGRRLVMVLDDVHEIDEVRDILPTRPGSAAIVISDRRSYAPWLTTSVQLGGLAEDDALDLLRELADPKRIDADPDGARGLVQVAEGLPAVLIEAAEQLARHPHWSLTRLVQRMTGERRDSESLRRVHSGVGRRLGRMPEPVRPVMQHLVDFDGPVRAGDLAQRFGMSVEEAEVHVDELVQYDLVDVVGAEGAGGAEPAYRAHPLIIAGPRVALRWSRETDTSGTRPA